MPEEKETKRNTSAKRYSPKAFTHISTGVVYASPGVVNMPPCVLHMRRNVARAA